MLRPSDSVFEALLDGLSRCCAHNPNRGVEVDAIMPLVSSQGGARRVQSLIAGLAIKFCHHPCRRTDAGLQFQCVLRIVTYMQRGGKSVEPYVLKAAVTKNRVDVVCISKSKWAGCCRVCR